MKHARLLFAVLLTLTATLVGARAQTLDSIIDRGTIRVAVDLGLPPWGSLDKNQKPIGFDVDMANLLAKDLGVELEIVPVTGPNRIAFLLTEKADLVIATFSVTPERAKAISFTNPYGANALVTAASKDLEIDGYADLTGKSIAVVRGTTQDGEVTQEAPQDATLRRYEDDATAATAILSGQVDAIVTGLSIAKELEKMDPRQSLEVKFMSRPAPYSMGLRRGDPDFLQYLNTFIYYHRMQGTIAGLFDKWVGGEMPPLSTF